MPRNKRIDIPGAIHHVIVRGLERNKIFTDDKDRGNFITRLKTTLTNTACQCYAWVLIPNHFHLLIRTGKRSLTDMMRSLLTGYAIYFNRRYNRHGYLYQNRYKSILCQEDRYLKRLVAYIHLNPLRARIVKTIEELDSYPWSGHIALIGNKYNNWQAIKEVLLYFSDKFKEARNNYRLFIEENAKKLLHEDLTGGGLKRSAGGWERVECLKRKKIFWRGDERILGDGTFVNTVLKEAEEEIERKELLRRSGWDLEKLVNHVCSLLPLKENELKKKGRQNNLSCAKGLLCYLGYAKLGLTGTELARYLGISRQAVYRNIIVGEKNNKEKDLS